MKEIVSAVPLIIFLIPAFFGILIFILGRKNLIVQETLAILGTMGSFAMSIMICTYNLAGKTIIFWNNEFRVDSLGGLLSFVIGLVGAIVIVYSIKYMRHDLATGMTTVERLSTFYGWVLLFIAAMMWVCTTNNIIMLYVIIEGTTIASALLVAFYWNKDSLEAGYKYLMLLTVGITFALFGCILLYVGAAPHAIGVDPLLITTIASVASKIPKSTVLLSVAFLLVGFGTKAGVAPFHAWLPDAHAEAPTPISVLLSGVMINVGAYAVVRTVTLFYHSYSPISIFVVILGIFTMLLGVFMMFVQEDLKRFLAYSSVSQIGYIMMGFGFGTYLGIYGGIFHLLNHAIIKSLLFLCVGAVIYRTGKRRLEDIGGLGKKMPLTAFCFFVGALAISGVPLLNGFMSKFTLFLAGAQHGMLWATIIAIFTSILTLACFIHVSYRIFMGEPKGEISEKEIKEIPVSMWIGIVILAALCLIIGVYPQAAYPILNKATLGIQSLMILK